uniref:Condensin complex subunit 1 C-terminal domain-containing protein n=1 Tax=Aegilops tauschii subsp. strangulata TaxID=200361 RepID=A0A453EU02_AEGTS
LGNYQDSFRCSSKDSSICAHKPSREELLPLIICAIERHPDSDVRDSLTHTLFNLIKRPDGQQRRIIMDACVELATSVGEMRTETELLPQCWEQVFQIF